MSSSQQNESPCKRTSHYYKKKLKLDNQIKIQNSIQVDKGKKIQKKPKQAKLRAKQARQRKKIYIEKLEQKIEQLQTELKFYKQRASAIQSNNSAFINLNKSQKSQAIKKSSSTQSSQEVIKLAGIQSAFHSLYSAVQLKKEQLAQKGINLLRENYGVAGQQRIKWFEQLLLKTVSIMMPLHCRQLLEYCQNKQQFYKLIGCGQNMKQDRKLYFDKSTITTLLESRPAMVEIKQKYRKILLNIINLSKSMIAQASQLQHQIDKIQKSMNPLFVGKILIDLDVQRKKTTNLNQIFPINFYKQQLLKQKYSQKIKHSIQSQYSEQQQIQRVHLFNDDQDYLRMELSYIDCD